MGLPVTDLPDEGSAIRGDPYRGLTWHEYSQLMVYNAERDRGILHTQEWQAAMSQLQRKYDIYKPE